MNACEKHKNSKKVSCLINKYRYMGFHFKAQIDFSKECPITNKDIQLIPVTHCKIIIQPLTIYDIFNYYNIANIL